MLNENVNVTIVRDLGYLVEKYGIDAVRHAMYYIQDFPAVKSQYRFKNTSGADWFLSEDEFKRVNNVWANGNGKIQAIKLFREITSCGLKEAKDAIESYYESQKPRY